MEVFNEDVLIGKAIDQNSYDRFRKHILIQNQIAIDFIQNKRIIHEVKKSRSIEEASIYQIKYYLYVMKNLDFEAEKGILDYPLLKKRQEVYLTEEDCTEIESILDQIRGIGDQKSNTFGTLNSGICKKCAYYDLCMI